MAPRIGPVRASLIPVACLLRSFPLFFRDVPGTPLRVLCIVALDTVHVLRHSQPLPRRRRQELAAFLDFQAGMNAAWDHKPLRTDDCDTIRQRLEQAGLGSWIEEYLNRLHVLETRRPSIGGDHRRFAEVRSYREAVARLSLAAVAGIALHAGCLDEALQATRVDEDVDTLFRMAMQCQIIDDVVDYRQDLTAGLPTFLTATASLPLAMSLTADAVRRYSAAPRCSARGGSALRVALGVLTVLTTQVVRVGRRTRPAPAAAR